MTIIYLAVRSQGEYEEYCTTNLKGSFNRALVEKFIEDDKAAYAEAERQDIALFEHYKAWDDRTPEEEEEDIVQIPKFPAGINQKDITQEMWDERARLRQHNRDVQDRNAERRKARAALWMIEYRAYMERLGLTLPINIPSYRSHGGRSFPERTYQIEEIELIDQPG